MEQRHYASGGGARRSRWPAAGGASRSAMVCEGAALVPQLEPAAAALTLPGDWTVEGLPAIVRRAGAAAAERVAEFFAARIRNASGTRLPCSSGASPNSCVRVKERQGSPAIPAAARSSSLPT